MITYKALHCKYSLQTDNGLKGQTNDININNSQADNEIFCFDSLNLKALHNIHV